MGTSEHWYKIKDGKLYYHHENDGIAVIRRGLDPRDELIGDAQSIVNYLKIRGARASRSAGGESVEQVLKEWEKEQELPQNSYGSRGETLSKN